MPPIKFWLNLTLVLEEISFEVFQDGRPGCHLEILQMISHLSLWCFPSSFGSIELTVWEEMSFEEFQDGCHGYMNGTILAILNLYVGPMPAITFWLNLTWFWRRFVWRMVAILDIGMEQNDYSNFESLCHCDASHQVSAQSDLGFGRRRRIWRLSILHLHVATMPPTKFQLNPTYGSGGDVENVKS